MARPSDSQRENPRFQQQYVSKGLSNNRQINIRCDDDFVALLEELGRCLELDRTSTLKLGSVFLARNLDRVKDDLDSGALKLMSCPVPQGLTVFFKGDRGRAVLPSDLMEVLEDFAHVRRLNNDVIRTAALDALKGRLNALFQELTSKSRGAANRELETPLDIV